MTREKFKDLVEAPALYGKEPLSLQSHIKGIIARTIRLTLQYPEEAKEYHNSLSKVVYDYNKPTI